MHALLLIDIQNDFLPGGSLAVPGGDRIIPIVNRLVDRFETVVATQDWHPANHGSFAANHPGRQVGEVIDLAGLPQILWPVHCVQNTPGAAFAPTLRTDRLSAVFQKGTDPAIDSYSGFFDNGHRRSTGLDHWLRSMGITTLFVAGLATDYCVKFSVLDARQLGYDVRLIKDACRGVELRPGDVGKSMDEMSASGAQIVTSDQIFRQPG